MNGSLSLLQGVVKAGIVLVLLVSCISSFGQTRDREPVNILDDDQDIEITGRYQTPEAWYILDNANLSYQSISQSRTFVPELLETVEEEPF